MNRKSQSSKLRNGSKKVPRGRPKNTRHALQIPMSLNGCLKHAGLSVCRLPIVMRFISVVASLDASLPSRCASQAPCVSCVSIRVCHDERDDSRLTQPAQPIAIVWILCVLPPSSTTNKMVSVQCATACAARGVHRRAPRRRLRALQTRRAALLRRRPCSSNHSHPRHRRHAAHAPGAIVIILATVAHALPHLDTAALELRRRQLELQQRFVGLERTLTSGLHADLHRRV
jgi:hypothetical protein